MSPSAASSAPPPDDEPRASETFARSAPAHVEFSFPPTEDLVNTVRKLVETFCGSVRANASESAKVALATHELLENAIKYSTHGQLWLRVELDPVGSRVLVRTRNHASAENIRQVRRCVDAIADAPDPAAHYQTLLASASRRSIGSGLGLGRIRFETELAVRVDVEGDVVVVEAAASRGDPT